MQGIIVKFAVDVIKQLLKKLDESGKVAENKAWIQPVVIVLSFVATALSLASQGHAEQVDVQSVVDLVTVYLSSVGANKVLKKPSIPPAAGNGS